MTTDTSMGEAEVEKISVCGRVMNQPLSGLDEKGRRKYHNYNPYLDGAQALALVKKFHLTIGSDTQSRYVYNSANNIRSRYSSDRGPTYLYAAIVECVYRSYL